MTKPLKIFLATLFLLFSGGPGAFGVEIPSLTWERGKTHNVVLGGYAENLDWEIQLEGEGNSKNFARSSKNSAGFFVYSLSIPRDLDVGQYQVVARGADGSKTIVSAIQVVERFQYNLLEIPRDLTFILLCFALFIAIQLILRTWVQQETDGLLQTEPFEKVHELSSPRRDFAGALIAQRLRLKRRWLGPDYARSGILHSDGLALALLPILALVLALYAGTSGALFPIRSIADGLLLALLVGISAWDRYAGKLASIGFLSLFVIFNSNLNFPTILALLLTAAMFFLPQHVGDVISEFIDREIYFVRARLVLGSSLPALGAGVSIFWLYLLGESLNLSGSTNASLVTPAAISAAIGLLARNHVFRDQVPTSALNRGEFQVRPLVGLKASFPLLAFAAAIFYIWTESELLSILAATSILSGFFFVYLSVAKVRSINNRYLANGGVQLVIVLALEVAILALTFRAPEVTVDRSKLIILCTGIPLLALAIIRLLTTIPETLPNSRKQLLADSEEHG